MSGGIIAIPVNDGHQAVGVVVRNDATPIELGTALLEAKPQFRTYAHMVAKVVFAHPGGYVLVPRGFDWSDGWPPCVCHSDGVGRLAPMNVVCESRGHNACMAIGCHPDTTAWLYRLYPQGVEVWRSDIIEVAYRHRLIERVPWDVLRPRLAMSDIYHERNRA